MAMCACRLGLYVAVVIMSSTSSAIIVRKPLAVPGVQVTVLALESGAQTIYASSSKKTLNGRRTGRMALLVCTIRATDQEAFRARSPRTASPYFSCLARPMPLIDSSCCGEEGRTSAIACRVRSVKTTYAGTDSALAVSERHARSSSNSSSSYVDGHPSQRPTLRSATVASGPLQTLHTDCPALARAG